MSNLQTQEQSSSDVAQLVQAIDRLVEMIETTGAPTKAPVEIDQPICPECGRPFDDDDWSPEESGDDDTEDEVAAESNGTVLSVVTGQAIFLGCEVDQCSGVLRVKNRNNRWCRIPRGLWTRVDVAIDGNGYWYWRCGTTPERSRGAPNFRPRVKRLRIYHSPNSRKITWKCYDLL